MTRIFGLPEIKTRVFEIELKHREPDDTTGEREELIATERMEIPDLKNRDWEEKWVTLNVWNSFSDQHFKEQGINQAFIFSEGFKRLIVRLELNKFHDEEAQQLDVPGEQEFQNWLNQVRKKFKKLYQFDFDKWQELNRQKSEQAAEYIQ